MVQYKLFFFIIALGCLSLFLCAEGQGEGSSRDEQIAYTFAPVIYQDVDPEDSYNHSLGGKADYITALNYDGDWDMTDNWDELGNHHLYAYVYYSVAETDTHRFIVYGFYHPRDWAQGAAGNFQEHENDFEGMLAVVKKEGQGYGTLKGIVTVFHNDFKYYSNFQTEGGHPKLGIECRGHGVKAYPHIQLDGGGVVYYPDSTAEEPDSPDDHHVSYKLKSFKSLWIMQLLQLTEEPDGNELFYCFGKMRGNNSGGVGEGVNLSARNAAAFPWRWDGDGDGVEAGYMAVHPVKLAHEHFPGDVYSYNYISNLYLGITPHKKKKYISDLTISSKKTCDYLELPPLHESWTYVPTDLNDDAKGYFIFLGWKRTDEKSGAITDLTFRAYSKEQTANPLTGWNWNNHDLNKGSGGKYIYMFWKKGERNKNPITDIMIYRDGRRESPPTFSGWTVINTDLNKGAGGDYIWAYYKRE